MTMIPMIVFFLWCGAYWHDDDGRHSYGSKEDFSVSRKEQVTLFGGIVISEIIGSSGFLSFHQLCYPGNLPFFMMTMMMTKMTT